jgi:hypothetical protein
VPDDYPVRDLDLSWVHSRLDRPSIDPVLMLRMLFARHCAVMCECDYQNQPGVGFLPEPETPIFFADKAKISRAVLDYFHGIALA